MKWKEATLEGRFTSHRIVFAHPRNPGFQVVALCDVDDSYAKRAFDRWPQARRYRDFREMLQAEASKIDAVYCGTPDHTIPSTSAAGGISARALSATWAAIT